MKRKVNFQNALIQILVGLSNENHAVWSRKLERELNSTNPYHYDKFFRMTPDEAADMIAEESQ